MNTQQSKTYVKQQGSPEMEVNSNTGLPIEGRKISNKQPNLTSKRTRGTTTNKQKQAEERK